MEKWVKKIISGKTNLDDISNNRLAQLCQIMNDYYRQGQAIVSDYDYDFIYLKQLKKKIPNHSFLHNIEPEKGLFLNKKIPLPERMLSTDKAYSFSDITKWLERLKKQANIHNINEDIIIKATPKLDGFAAFDSGDKLYSRGDGYKGFDISRVFLRGLSVYKNAKRGLGAGEIVVKKSYFNKYLSNDFEHARNFQASLLKEKELDEKVKQAIAKKATVFVPFKLLPNWQGKVEELLVDFVKIVDNILNTVDFIVDGVIFETTNKILKENIGATNKFHRWQIAFKENKLNAKVKILGITPQLGRTGVVTPVCELEAVFLSGATLSRASAHNYGWVKKNSLGIDSEVNLVRSGEVIPKITQIFKKSKKIQMPNNCPSCQSLLVWRNDFLVCINYNNCQEQIIHQILYFFQTLANNDGFGLATIEKIVSFGIKEISQIYELRSQDFIKIGFGEKTSANLITELKRSLQEAVEDWRFLASLGIVKLGISNCQKLLSFYNLDEIFLIKKQDLIYIDGFAQISADAIFEDLQRKKTLYKNLSKLNFNLIISTKNNIQDITDNKKTLVFSGAMQYTREKMQSLAKDYGFMVSNSISKKVDFLVIGDSVGNTKLQKAKKLGINIISEKDFYKKIKK